MSKIVTFVGRKGELAALNDLLYKKTASLVVVKGRRRIGKSRLITQFANGKKLFSFSGLPPEKKITAQMQRDEFSKQLGLQSHLPNIKANDWIYLFY